VKLITWGDGLSCERHVDAQNARANAEIPLDQLEGLDPSPQEQMDAPHAGLCIGFFT